MVEGKIRKRLLRLLDKEHFEPLTSDEIEEAVLNLIELLVKGKM